MNAKVPKHYQCARDHGLGVLLVDIESETIPRTDKQGCCQYYCLKGHHVFPVHLSNIEVSAVKEQPQKITTMV